MHPLIGIDLGTTHCVAAVYAHGDTEVLPLEGDATLLPSLVARVDGEWLVGEAARAHDHVARVKTDLATPARYELDGHDLDPVHASALLLRAVASHAGGALGTPVRRAVVTVPAWFREPQRRATQAAAQQAGLELLRLVHEPTAAALAWGLHDLDTERLIVVLDLGGGTFDVSVLDVFERIVEVRASSGDTRLGGEDVTDLLADDLVRRAGLEPAEARRAAEQAKRELSYREHTSVVDAQQRPCALTRGDLEHLCRPFLTRLRRCIDDALQAAELSTDEVDEVLLVGGASRMPMVADLAREVFGRDPRISDDPDHIVARGAAVQAALLARDAAVADVVITEALPHSLGVNCLEQHGDRYLEDRTSVVLSRGTTLPATRQQRYWPVHEEQRSMVFRVVQGERRVASENEQLGVLEVELPPTEGDRSVQVRFTHDLDGLLEVEATVVATGERVSAILQRGSGQQVEQRLATLKVAARELFPNAQALRRAHALFEQLAPGRRERLVRVLGPFEAALEHDDRVAADATRPALLAAIDELS
jgi:molecular chaperone HscC